MVFAELMRRLLWILPLLLLTTCNQPYRASRGVDDRWYIATAANGGSDTDGDGSLAHPWLTLKHAADTITGAAFVGDTIVVGVGEFVETAQISLGVGVSIYGAGNTSIIKSTYAYTDYWPSTLIATIKLRSTSEGTEGNQSISYIRMDGDNLTATAAICVSARSNVDIHHCEFEDFDNYGVSFTGTVDMSYGEATTYASSNSFHHNTMINCVTDESGTPGYPAGGRGSLMIGSDEDMSIYSNTFVEVNRGTGNLQYAIQKMCFGFHKGLKIYNNDMTTHGIELWFCRGGIEIYGNQIQKAIDFGGIDATWGNEDINDAAGYGFGAKVYDNIIGNAAYETDWLSGINLEQTIKGGVYIYRNIIYRRPVPIMFSPGSNNCVVRDTYIYNNVFYDIGRTGSPLAYGIWLKTSADGVTVSNINILNNHIISGESPAMYAGICFGKVSGDTINIKNNIIQGAADYAISFDAGDTLDVVNIQKNLFYDNAHSNTILTAATSVLTNDVVDNLTPADPLFKSAGNFRLQSTSPAINAGIAVGLTSDFAGHRIPQQDTVDIGAYEYGDYLCLTPSGKLLRNANGKFMIIH
jgi:hypothetical protein